jgi:acyl-coenzyme A synthetase/AMP-(fatty) acid ligase
VKVHPLPVEERIGAVPGVQLVRVYGRPNAVTGAIVAAEIVPSPGTDPDELADRVRAACADLADTARPRSIRFVDTLATTSDKISRRVPAGAGGTPT